MDTLQELLRRLGSTLADFVIFLVRVRESFLWQGIVVNVVMLAGQSEVNVVHGLGRAHLGAFLVTSDAAVPVFARVATDSEHVRLFTAAPLAADIRFRVWVF